MGTAVISVRKGHSEETRATWLAYAGVAMFVLLYFTRPSDWIPGAANVPLAKVAAFFAIGAFCLSLGHLRQRLPREVIYLILLFVQLCLTVPFSPVWRGGSFMHVVDFAKIVLIIVVMSMSVITPSRLRKIILIQTVSLIVVASATIINRQHLTGRLEGAIGGDFSNPNDLGLAIALILPFGLMFFLGMRSILARGFWAIALVILLYASFRTASRSGFIALFAVLAVSLWQFGVKGRRPYLLALVAIAGLGIWTLTSAQLIERFEAIFNPKDTNGAYSSAQQREQLLWRSLEVTMEHPLFGVGPGNFTTVSGVWRTTHNSYTLMSAEGGLPAFALYLMILWRAARNIRTAKKLRLGDRNHQLLADALHASLAGYLVGSFFSSVAYSFFPYLLVAYTTGIVRSADTSGMEPRKGIESATSEFGEFHESVGDFNGTQTESEAF